MSRMVAAGLRLAMPGARMGLRSCKSQLGRAFLGERAGVQRGGYGLVGAAGRDTVWGNRRAYSAPAGLAKPEVEGRIIDLLKNFDKVWILVFCVYVSILLLVIEYAVDTVI